MSDVYQTLIYLATTPFQWLILLIESGTQMLSDRMVLALMAFLAGMVVMLILQGLLLWKVFRDQPVAPPPTCQRPVIRLPESLRNRLNHQSLKQKEDCVWLNFLTHFLFAELRDSVNVRRFLTKRIHKEFEEVLTSKTGVFVDELFLRDFSLGNKFPVFTVVCVDKCDLKKDIIETLDIRAKMLYDGGFEIAIDAALPFGRTAFICVKIMKLKGNLRFQFTSNPFCHWSISFYEEPEIELDVSAQLDGRPMNKLKNIIASQIRRTLRKKHTLPTYKIRYKPFFQAKVEKALVKPQNLLIDGIQIGSGVLEVTIISASRLPVINKDAKLYCTLSVDDLPWKQMVTKERLKKPVLRKELVKHSSDQSLGLTVKDELVPDRLHPVVVVEQVAVGSPAHLADFKEGDIIISVSGNKVTSAKQATKFLRSAKDKVSLQVETTISGLELKVTRSEERMGRRYSDMTFDGEKPENTYLSNILNMQTGLEGSASTISVPSTLSSSSSAKSKKWDVRKSRLINSVHNPSWDQKFIFTVNPNTAYLNICVWSHGGDRSARTDVIGSSNQDILIGYTSLNLDDIFLHCLVTLSGTLQDKVKLKHGQYQTEAELTKEWASHKGWDPELMYGDLTLGFYFIPSLLSSNQRKSMASCRNDVLRKKTQTSAGVKQPTGGEDVATVLESQSSIDECQVYSQGHHQFDSTSFVTATFCDYCGKKIWMKEAFKCRTCNMVCHKKCLVKCLVNTFCTDGGVKKRSAQDEKWEPSSRSRSITLNTDPSMKNQATGVDGKPVARQGAKTGHLENDSLKSQVTSNEDVSDTEESISRDSSAKTSSQIDEPTSSSYRSSEISNTLGRFRNLKERTDKIKDNVLRNLKKAKSPLTLSDKEVLEAKDTGTKLFLDMEPAQRKDKLDELITHLDEQLKMEMKNKESHEKELPLLNSAADAGGIPTSKKRAEIRALENKIAKSTEKLDAMRLLMLQYCTALQHCINVLEQDEDGQHGEPSQHAISPHGSRVSYMGGFVKRASSSVKEKMSSIRKDFGKKGSVKPANLASKTESRSSDVSKCPDGRNNNRLLSTILDGFSSKGGKAGDGIQLSEPSSSKGMAEMDVKKDAIEEMDTHRSLPQEIRGPLRFESFGDGETLVISTDDTHPSGEARAASLPRIQVDLKDFDDTINFNHFSNPSDVNVSHVKDKTEHEPKSLVRADSKISRSNSDSRLEINKMVSLNPDDILRYHGNSLPKICISEDENSESDFLVIDSSDENELSDFYEDDSDDGKREDSPSLTMLPELIIGGRLPSSFGANEVDDQEEKQDQTSHGNDEDAVSEHRNLTQECHSYVV